MYLLKPINLFLSFGKNILIKPAVEYGIINTVATGINTSKKVKVEELFNKIGSRIGRRNAIVKLVSKIEITVNSIFLFNKFIIIGAAIAVGAIAVIKITCASVGLNCFTNKYDTIGTNKLIINIFKWFMLKCSFFTSIFKKEKKSIIMRKYLIRYE